MDGLILVDKPGGCTSHDVVQALRRILRFRKIGHFGTLDPMAEGLLLIGTGSATRLFPYLSRTRKIYEGSIRLSLATDTYDREGEIISQYDGPLPDRQTVEQAMAEFVGEIRQVPPPYSAKKFNGQPLYVSARKKKPVLLKPSLVTVFFFRMTEFSPPTFRFQAACSSGTYIRSLAHDLGTNLGCGACLDALRRTVVGDYKLDEARTLDEIEKLTKEDRIGDFLKPMESLLPEYPSVALEDPDVRLAKHGNSISLHTIRGTPPSLENEDGIVRLFDRDGQLIALGKLKTVTHELHPFLVFETD
jgi:tRNA pseudouridine55 synthase